MCVCVFGGKCRVGLRGEESGMGCKISSELIFNSGGQNFHPTFTPPSVRSRTVRANRGGMDYGGE